MELIQYLRQQEGKTLEFKENCLSLPKILQTVVALANTAGGALIIGVRDKTKEVIGLSDPLKEEERLSNAFADGIRPLMIPDIQFNSFRDRNLIIVSVPHAIGPYFVRSEGPEKGVYVRLGSTNRRAGPDMIEAICRLSRNISFDEQPCTEINSEDIDFRAASEFFTSVSRQLTPSISKTLGLIVSQGGKDIPTLGAVLLFGKNRHRFFLMPSFGVLVSGEQIRTVFWISWKSMNIFQKRLKRPFPLSSVIPSRLLKSGVFADGRCLNILFKRFEKPSLTPLFTPIMPSAA